MAPNRGSRRKSAVHQSRSGLLSPYRSEKGSLIEKKLQKSPISCFYNGRITETEQIREKLSSEHRVEAIGPGKSYRAELGLEDQVEARVPNGS